MIKVAGVGPGNPKLLTLEVMDLIKSSKRVLAFGRIKETLKDERFDIIKISGVSELLKDLKENPEDTLVLASGDPNFFGIVELLKKNSINIEEVYPGISSLQYLCSKIKMPYSKVENLSLHGRKGEIVGIEKEKTYTFLIDKTNNGNFISKYLWDLGYRGDIYFGYNLSYDDEVILKKKVGEEINEPSSLGVILVVPNVD